MCLSRLDFFVNILSNFVIFAVNVSLSLLANFITALQKLNNAMRNWPKSIIETMYF